MHIADPATGNLGANAIVGGSAGIATGAAFASKYLRNNRVTVCFFGEGALGQGLLYEEMNLAQLWKLPVIFVCENNGYNEYTHFSEIDGGRGRAPAPPRSASPTRPSTARTSAMSTPRRRSTSRGRARATARRSWSARPTATTAITSATSPAPTTGRKRKKKSG